MRFFNFFVCLGVLCGGVVGCGHVAWFSSKANLRRNQRRILAQQDIRDTGSSCRNDESICKTRAEVNPFVLGYCNTESGHCECANNALYEPSQDDCCTSFMQKEERQREREKKHLAGCACRIAY